MIFLRSDKSLFSEGFLFIDNVTVDNNPSPLPPLPLPSNKTLGELANISLKDMMNMSLAELAGTN